MSNITTENKATFFPKRKSGSIKTDKSTEGITRSKDIERRKELLNNKSEQDAKVDIPQKIKDFAKIKKVVDATPDNDNSEKISALKNQIENGEYEINYNGLAEKILEEKF